MQVVLIVPVEAGSFGQRFPDTDALLTRLKLAYLWTF